MQIDSLGLMAQPYGVPCLPLALGLEMTYPAAWFVEVQPCWVPTMPQRAGSALLVPCWAEAPCRLGLSSPTWARPGITILINHVITTG